MFLDKDPPAKAGTCPDLSPEQSVRERPSTSGRDCASESKAHSCEEKNVELIIAFYKLQKRLHDLNLLHIDTAEFADRCEGLSKDIKRLFKEQSSV